MIVQYPMVHGKSGAGFCRRCLVHRRRPAPCLASRLRLVVGRFGDSWKLARRFCFYVNYFPAQSTEVPISSGVLRPKTRISFVWVKGLAGNFRVLVNAEELVETDEPDSVCYQSIQPR